MKRFAIAYAVLLITTAFTPKQQNITFFEGSFSEALKASKKQNKPIFIDSYTTSCKWCKKMDRTTFRNRNVVKYLNANFINVKMNMRSVEGKMMKNKYGINALPTLLFVNSRGKSLARVNGYSDATAFMKKAKRAKRRFK